MDGGREADDVSHRRCCSCVGPQHERSCVHEFSRMLEEEAALRSCSDHVALQTKREPSNQVWREKVCQWCYDVIDHLGASRGIVYISMNILDRFCALESSARFSRDEKAYELAAMTGLFLALRLSGRRGFGASEITRMSRQGVQVQDIVNMGKSMIEKLSWNRRLPTPLNFVEAFAAQLPPSVDADTRRSLVESASYLVEISVCDAFFSGVSSTKVAYCAVINASCGDGTWRVNDADLSGLHLRLEAMTNLRRDSRELRELRSRLHHIYRQSEDSAQAPPHVIPEAEGRNASVVLSKPVSMRIVSSDNFQAKSIRASREAPASLRSVKESHSSPNTVGEIEGISGEKRPVSPVLLPEDQPKPTKCLRTS